MKEQSNNIHQNNNDVTDMTRTMDQDSEDRDLIQGLVRVHKANFQSQQLLAQKHQQITQIMSQHSR